MRLRSAPQHYANQERAVEPDPRIRGGIGADEQYWAALERSAFKLLCCSSCHIWMWPAHFRYGHCGSWEIAWEDVEPVGTIYTWARNHAVSDLIKERREDGCPHRGSRAVCRPAGRRPRQGIRDDGLGNYRTRQLSAHHPFRSLAAVVCIGQIPLLQARNLARSLNQAGPADDRCGV